MPAIHFPIIPATAPQHLTDILPIERMSPHDDGVTGPRIPAQGLNIRDEADP
jgi:hypothetical protein